MTKYPMKEITRKKFKCSSFKQNILNKQKLTIKTFQCLHDTTVEVLKKKTIRNGMKTPKYGFYHWFWLVCA